MFELVVNEGGCTVEEYLEIVEFPSVWMVLLDSGGNGDHLGAGLDWRRRMVWGRGHGPELEAWEAAETAYMLIGKRRAQLNEAGGRRARERDMEGGKEGDG